MDVSDKRDLYSGFSDALGRAVEYAGVPILFGLGGRWLDGRFDTSPLFLIVLVLFAVIGLGVRTYYQYGARMDAIDAASPWKAGNR